MTGTGKGQGWRTSSFCANAANCVEVRFGQAGEIEVRDGKQRLGAVLSFTAEEWSAFLAGVREGEFDAA